MAISKIITASITDSAVTSASIADDAIAQADIGTIQSVGETAPSSPFIGQRWYRASTAITYQYTNDGTSSFWLDISSAGIGTSPSKGVDFVGDVDPIATTNLGAVGNVYYNRETNKHFVCTTATSGSQVWAGDYIVETYSGITGGTITTYVLNNQKYRVHSFTSTGNTNFVTNVQTVVDYLVVAGGGQGGHGELAGGGDGAGGGGAGGLRTGSLLITPQTYAITVGAGGSGNTSISARGNSGANSVFSSITSTGGGGGGSDANHATNSDGAPGGSGGGASSEWNAANAGGAGTAGQGQNGGVARQNTSSNWRGGGGGGGSRMVGGDTCLSQGGQGGHGHVNYLRLGVTGTAYAGGGGGGGGGATSYTGGAGGMGGGGLGAQGNDDTTIGVAGTANTGGGGGGGKGFSSSQPNTAHIGGAGGSGIVVIRYAINS